MGACVADSAKRFLDSSTKIFLSSRGKEKTIPIVLTSRNSQFFTIRTKNLELSSSIYNSLVKLSFLSEQSARIFLKIVTELALPYSFAALISYHIVMLRWPPLSAWWFLD